MSPQTAASKRTLIALTGVLLSASTVLAQCDSASLFGSALVSDTGLSPVFLALDDLDADGVPDLAVANRDSGSVSVLLGNGDGTFQPRQDFATGASPVFVAIGDLNSDGVPDLAVANRDSGSVSVLLGNGDGNFQARQDFSTANGPRSLAIGDLNADGTPDIVTTNFNLVSSSVSVLLGNGDGTFQPRQDLASGLRPTAVAIGDLNGDGLLDLAVTNLASQDFSVFLGNGDGTFQPRQDYAAPGSARSVAIDDLNDDGVPDLAIASEALDSGSVSVLLGNGDGTFQPRQDYNFLSSSPLFVAIGNLNGDGVFDLVVGNANSSSVNLLLGNGDGTFQPSLSFGSIGSTQYCVAIGDLDADGMSDLAIASSSSISAAAVLLNQCEPLPIIAQQPESILVGPTPVPVSFSVVASSDLSLSFQWLRDGVPLSDDAQISGALTPTLTIQADATDAALYRCMLSTTFGTMTSNEAILGFRANPNPCPADLNSDGLLNFFDIVTYINIFNAGCP